MDKDIVSKLQQVQSELVAPKGQYNAFGKYKYRSCEDILEALKPVLAKIGAVLTVSDCVMRIGDRYYVQATANFRIGDSIIYVNAYAREAESQKGMSEPQITGSASSYARKYALNGLFAIDDTKDADTQPPPEPKGKAVVKKPVAQKPATVIKSEGQSGMQKWLNTAKAEKKRIGDKPYYTIMGSFGFEHANEIVERKAQIAVYSDLSTIKTKEQ